MTAFTPTDQEAIILNQTWEMIDDMVNFELFEKFDRVDDTNLIFRTSSHQRLFNILLGDFLSQPRKWGGNPMIFDLPDAPRTAREADRTNLFYVRHVCDAPKLGSSPEALREKVNSLADWLSARALVKDVWLPSIEVKLDIQIERIIFIKICGNIGKHNLVRLENNVAKICDILAKHGHPIDAASGYLVLGDFYDWFHRHVFAYHASTIAEHLNEIRWAIFHYLEPEYQRSHRQIDEVAYEYNYPAASRHPFGKSMYWDLMNRVRARPYFPRFTVTNSLKKRY
jgi:hypothetical protein